MKKNYRSFTLSNERGNELNLSEPRALFLTEVKGLGQKKEVDTIQKQGFHSIVEIVEEPVVITGVMRYGYTLEESYTQFVKFATFVNASNDLTLSYELPIDGEYTRVYAKVIVDVIEKGEAGENGTLDEKVSFFRLEPWHSKEMQVTAITKSTNGNAYDPNQEYDVKYGSSSGSVLLNNLSTNHAPIVFAINGAATNPVIRLKNTYTNKIQVQWQYLGTVSLGNTLFHNSYPGKESVKMNNITNVYANVNKNPGFSSLIMVPPGIFELEFICENLDPGDLTVYKANYYGVI